MGRKARELQRMICHASPAADHKGKPWETMGRKTRELQRDIAMPARSLIHISKPWETMGRKAMGAKVLLCYASPAAGYFASDLAKKGRQL